ncbi:MAG: RluA family pseudouridine synthase [Phycisphaerales bacterium]|nr:RluA family pseudouridine synthase [Phycisphaerales bacterium]
MPLDPRHIRPQERAPAGSRGATPNPAAPPVDDPAPDLSLLTGGGKVDPDLVRAASAGGDEDNTDAALTVTFRLTRDLRKRLDKYLQDRIPFMSRTQLQRLISERAVTVNDRQPKASTTLRIGDVVTVVVPPPPTKDIPAEDIPLQVLYEDDDLIVVNKQPELIVHPARGNKRGTLINALVWHFTHRTAGALSSVGADDARPGVVHRLDRSTTGAIVVAKTDIAHWRLARQFENRTTDKRYLAVVHGRVEPVADIIDQPIGKHPIHRELMAVRYDDAAKPSQTLYRVREQFDEFALVELELHTGRTHQIRVHLAHLGWPIVGDEPYGGQGASEQQIARGGGSAEPVITRQALHATSLAVRHPMTGQPMEFIAPLWPDMRWLIDLLRRHRRTTGPIAPAGSRVDVEALLNQPTSPAG